MNQKKTKSLCILTLCLINVHQLYGQIFLKEDSAGTVVIEKVYEGKRMIVEESDLAQAFNATTGIRIDGHGLKTGTTFNVIVKGKNGAEANATTNPDYFQKIDGGKVIRYIRQKKITALKIVVNFSGGQPDKIFYNIGANNVAYESDETGGNDESTESGNTGGRWPLYSNEQLRDIYTNIARTKRYYSKSNRAIVYLDPNGNIIGRKPVNLDQDDEVIFKIFVPDDERYDQYQIDDNGAGYIPVDLLMRSTDNIISDATQSGEKTTNATYTIKEIYKGPYTTQDVTFTVKLGDRALNNFTLHINPLVHVAIGVSYISSNLLSPDFTVVPVPSSNGVNTIQAINDGGRTFITFNVIWYWWPTLLYIRGDHLTRGRDVLKEPSFMARINPTFGLALSSSLQDNFFVGGTFEFARGGSLCAGWHYGKVNRLVDQSFELGVSPYSGTDSEIVTESVWEWGTFIGVMLDTRIFNSIFNRFVDRN